MDQEVFMDKKHSIGHLSCEGAQYHKDGDLDNAVSCYEKAYKLARECNNDKIERTCAFNLGAAYIASDKAREGIKFLHKALPPEGQIDDRSNGDLYFNMGLGHEKMQERSKALVDFNKAYDEYSERESERANEQIQCLEKIYDIYKKLHKMTEMAETCRKMAEVLKRHGDDLGRADKLCEQASILKLNGNREDSLHVAEECMNIMANIQMEGDNCNTAAKILNDLGLVFTQLQKYDQATSCFERAVEMVKNSHNVHPQLEAVVLQNLGAAYNFNCDFQRAIKFHEDAASKYAKISYRNGQGQCFTNLAFALSQLGDMKRAEVAFHHALQASKDTGDNHMRWQALEGIGAVNYNQGNVREAADFFMDALKYIGENTSASERIKSKLYEAVGSASSGQKQVLYWQPSGSTSPEYKLGSTSGRQYMPPHGPAEDYAQMSATPRSHLSEIEAQIQPYNSVPLAGEQPAMSSVQDSRPRGRMLRMRKADSIGPHRPKISRGLESGTVETPRDTRIKHGQFTQSVLDSGGDEDEKDDEDSDEEMDEEESTEGSSDGGDSVDMDKASSQHKINQIFARSSAVTSASPIAEEKHLSMYEQHLREQEEKEDSEETTGSEEDSDDSEAEEDQKILMAPPLPTQPPPSTMNLNACTYLTPAPNKEFTVAVAESQLVSQSRTTKQELSPNSDESDESADEDTNPYATIDPSTKMYQRDLNGQGNENELVTIQHQKSVEGHLKSQNFFDSDGSVDNKVQTRNKTEREGSGVGSEDEAAVDRMPRGQREQMLAQYHQEHMAHAEQSPPELPPRKEDKNSKTCVIM